MESPADRQSIRQSVDYQLQHVDEGIVTPVTPQSAAVAENLQIELLHVRTIVIARTINSTASHITSHVQVHLLWFQNQIRQRFRDNEVIEPMLDELLTAIAEEELEYRDIKQYEDEKKEVNLS